MLVHGCEVCACAVSATESIVRGNRQLETSAAGSRLARSMSVFEYELDDIHRLLFQPVGDGEAVVNEPAYRIFRVSTGPPRWPTCARPSRRQPAALMR